MFPVLIQIGDFPVHTYGVLIAVGFLTSIYFARKEAIRQGIPGEKIVDFGFWSLLVGMFGARILFIITRWSYFMEFPLQMFAVWQGGLVFYGGPIAAFPFLIWFCKKNKLDPWKIADISAIALPIAHAIGRLGCLSAGCCHGKQTTMPWGMKFDSELVEFHLRGVPLHPTQLYEALALTLLSAYLYRRIKRKKFDGEIAFIYVGAYSVIRTVVEMFRGDTIRGYLIEGVLTTSQFISILTLITACIFWIYRKKSLSHRKEDS